MRRWSSWTRPRPTSTRRSKHRSSRPGLPAAGSYGADHRPPAGQAAAAPTGSWCWTRAGSSSRAITPAYAGTGALLALVQGYERPPAGERDEEDAADNLHIDQHPMPPTGRTAEHRPPEGLGGPARSVLVRLLRLAAPLAGRMALATGLGLATVGSSIGLMGTAAYLIARAALQTVHRRSSGGHRRRSLFRHCPRHLPLPGAHGLS